VSQHDWALKYACHLIQYYASDDRRTANINSLKDQIGVYVEKKAREGNDKYF